METKPPYKLKHQYYLDLDTGFIKGATETIETSELYKNRFIPWTAAIPKSGRVDLEAWQKQASQSAEMSAEDIAKFDEFQAWKKEQQTTAGTVVAGQNPAGAVIPQAEVVASIAGSGVIKEAVDDQQKDKEAGVGDPAVVVLTAGQRLDKIMAAIPTLTEDDFTKSANPMPSVKALSEKCGFEVEGHEREQGWAEFKKANPDWKPKAE